MKASLLLLTFLVGVQSFSPCRAPTGRAPAGLRALLDEGDMTADQKEIKEIQDTWNSIRHMDREQAQKELKGEWLEAFNRYYKQYDDDMAWMEEVAEKLEPLINPPRIQKKTQGQRKRDAYARMLERESNAA